MSNFNQPMHAQGQGESCSEGHAYPARNYDVASRFLPSASHGHSNNRSHVSYNPASDRPDPQPLEAPTATPNGAVLRGRRNSDPGQKTVAMTSQNLPTRPNCPHRCIQRQQQIPQIMQNLRPDHGQLLQSQSSFLNGTCNRTNLCQPSATTYNSYADSHPMVPTLQTVLHNQVICPPQNHLPDSQLFQTPLFSQLPTVYGVQMRYLQPVLLQPLRHMPQRRPVSYIECVHQGHTPQGPLGPSMHPNEYPFCSAPQMGIIWDSEIFEPFVPQRHPSSLNDPYPPTETYQIMPLNHNQPLGFSQPVAPQESIAPNSGLPNPGPVIQSHDNNDHDHCPTMNQESRRSENGIHQPAEVNQTHNVNGRPLEEVTPQDQSCHVGFLGNNQERVSAGIEQLNQVGCADSHDTEISNTDEPVDPMISNQDQDDTPTLTVETGKTGVTKCFDARNTEASTATQRKSRADATSNGPSKSTPAKSSPETSGIKQKNTPDIYKAPCLRSGWKSPSKDKEKAVNKKVSPEVSTQHVDDNDFHEVPPHAETCAFLPHQLDSGSDKTNPIPTYSLLLSEKWTTQLVNLAVPESPMVHEVDPSEPVQLFYTVMLNKKPPVYEVPDTIRGIIAVGIRQTFQCPGIRLRIRGTAYVTIAETAQNCNITVKKDFVYIHKTVAVSLKANWIFPQTYLEIPFKLDLIDGPYPKYYRDLSVKVEYALEMQIVLCPVLMEKDNDDRHADCETPWLPLSNIYVQGKNWIHPLCNYKATRFEQAITFKYRHNREVHSKLTFRGRLPRTVFALGDVVDLTVTVTGLSESPPEHQIQATFSPMLLQKVFLDGTLHITLQRVMKTDLVDAKQFWVGSKAEKTFLFRLEIGNILTSSNVKTEFSTGAFKVLYYLKMLLSIPGTNLPYAVLTKQISIIEDCAVHRQSCGKGAGIKKHKLPHFVQAVSVDMECVSDDDEEKKDVASPLDILVSDIKRKNPRRGQCLKEKKKALDICEKGSLYALAYLTEVEVGPKESGAKKVLSRKEELLRRKVERKVGKKVAKCIPVSSSNGSVNEALTNIVDSSKLKVAARWQRKALRNHLKRVLFRAVLHHKWLRENMPDSGSAQKEPKMENETIREDVKIRNSKPDENRWSVNSYKLSCFSTNMKGGELAMHAQSKTYDINGDCEDVSKSDAFVLVNDMRGWQDYISPEHDKQTEESSGCDYRVPVLVIKLDVQANQCSECGNTKSNIEDKEKCSIAASTLKAEASVSGVQENSYPCVIDNCNAIQKVSQNASQISNASQLFAGDEIQVKKGTEDVSNYVQDKTQTSQKEPQSFSEKKNKGRKIPQEKGYDMLNPHCPGNVITEAKSNKQNVPIDINFGDLNERRNAEVQKVSKQNKCQSGEIKITDIKNMPSNQIGKEMEEDCGDTKFHGTDTGPVSFSVATAEVREQTNSEDQQNQNLSNTTNNYFGAKNQGYAACKRAVCKRLEIQEKTKKQTVLDKDNERCNIQGENNQDGSPRQNVYTDITAANSNESKMKKEKELDTTDGIGACDKDDTTFDTLKAVAKFEYRNGNNGDEEAAPGLEYTHSKPENEVCSGYIMHQEDIKVYGQTENQNYYDASKKIKGSKAAETDEINEKIVVKDDTLEVFVELESGHDNKVSDDHELRATGSSISLLKSSSGGSKSFNSLDLNVESFIFNNGKTGVKCHEAQKHRKVKKEIEKMSKKRTTHEKCTNDESCSEELHCDELSHRSETAEEKQCSNCGENDGTLDVCLDMLTEKDSGHKSTPQSIKDGSQLHLNEANPSTIETVSVDTEATKRITQESNEIKVKEPLKGNATTNSEDDSLKTINLSEMSENISRSKGPLPIYNQTAPLSNSNHAECKEVRLHQDISENLEQTIDANIEESAKNEHRQLCQNMPQGLNQIEQSSTTSNKEIKAVKSYHNVCEGSALEMDASEGYKAKHKKTELSKKINQVHNKRKLAGTGDEECKVVQSHLNDLEGTNLKINANTKEKAENEKTESPQKTVQDHSQMEQVSKTHGEDIRENQNHHTISEDLSQMIDANTIVEKGKIELSQTELRGHNHIDQLSKMGDKELDVALPHHFYSEGKDLAIDRAKNETMEHSKERLQIQNTNYYGVSGADRSLSQNIKPNIQELRTLSSKIRTENYIKASSVVTSHHNIYRKDGVQTVHAQSVSAQPNETIADVTSIKTRNNTHDSIEKEETKDSKAKFPVNIKVRRQKISHRLLSAFQKEKFNELSKGKPELSVIPEERSSREADSFKLGDFKNIPDTSCIKEEKNPHVLQERPLENDTCPPSKANTYSEGVSNPPSKFEEYEIDHDILFKQINTNGYEYESLPSPRLLENTVNIQSESASESASIQCENQSSSTAGDHTTAFSHQNLPNQRPFDTAESRMLTMLKKRELKMMFEGPSDNGSHYQKEIKNSRPKKQSSKGKRDITKLNDDTCNAGTNIEPRSHDVENTDINGNPIPNFCTKLFTSNCNNQHWHQPPVHLDSVNHDPLALHTEVIVSGLKSNSLEQTADDVSCLALDQINKSASRLKTEYITRTKCEDEKPLTFDTIKQQLEAWGSQEIASMKKKEEVRQNALGIYGAPNPVMNSRDRWSYIPPTMKEVLAEEDRRPMKAVKLNVNAEEFKPRYLSNVPDARPSLAIESKGWAKPDLLSYNANDIYTPYECASETTYRENAPVAARPHLAYDQFVYPYKILEHPKGTYYCGEPVDLGCAKKKVNFNTSNAIQDVFGSETSDEKLGLLVRCIKYFLDGDPDGLPEQSNMPYLKYFHDTLHTLVRLAVSKIDNPKQSKVIPIFKMKMNQNRTTKSALETWTSGTTSSASETAITASSSSAATTCITVPGLHYVTNFENDNEDQSIGCTQTKSNHEVSPSYFFGRNSQANNQDEPDLQAETISEVTEQRDHAEQSDLYNRYLISSSLKPNHQERKCTKKEQAANLETLRSDWSSYQSFQRAQSSVPSSLSQYHNMFSADWSDFSAWSQQAASFGYPPKENYEVQAVEQRMYDSNRNESQATRQSPKLGYPFRYEEQPQYDACSTMTSLNEQGLSHINGNGKWDTGYKQADQHHDNLLAQEIYNIWAVPQNFDPTMLWRHNVENQQTCRNTQDQEQPEQQNNYFNPETGPRQRRQRKQQQQQGHHSTHPESGSRQRTQREQQPGREQQKEYEHQHESKQQKQLQEQQSEQKQQQREQQLYQLQQQHQQDLEFPPLQRHQQHTQQQSRQGTRSNRRVESFERKKGRELDHLFQENGHSSSYQQFQSPRRQTANSSPSSFRGNQRHHTQPFRSPSTQKK